LNQKNIKIINGLPYYNPRNQGAVERIHITVRTQLLALYLENISEFNLETAIVKAMNIYNKAIHKVTKYSPNEVFYSHDENLFQKVHDNILEFFNKNQKKESIFKSNEKCLLINNFIISKNKENGHLILLYNKVKKNHSFIKICVEILDYINGGNYLIKIYGNYNMYNIYNGEKYYVKCNLLRKCDENSWENLYKLISITDLIDEKKEYDYDINSSDSGESFVNNNELSHDLNVKLENENEQLYTMEKRKRFNSY
jgi:hypothetical protein